MRLLTLGIFVGILWLRWGNSPDRVNGRQTGAMAMSWQELTNLTRGQDMVVLKARVAATGIAIEGEFELPPLARLAYEDQVFVAAFVKAHGSIKEMEGLFGVSYPTIKNRLNRIAGQLEFVQVKSVSEREELLAKLERGEITAAEAIEGLQK